MSTPKDLVGAVAVVIDLVRSARRLAERSGLVDVRTMVASTRASMERIYCPAECNRQDQRQCQYRQWVIYGLCHSIPFG